MRSLRKLFSTVESGMTEPAAHQQVPHQFSKTWATEIGLRLRGLLLGGHCCCSHLCIQRYPVGQQLLPRSTQGVRGSLCKLSASRVALRGFPVVILL